MPAGLSHSTQSKLARSSPMTRADALLGQRVLVPGLRGRQQPQSVETLVADQGLRQLGDALHDVDQIEHDAPFGAHHEIEIAQADVEIHDDDLLSGLRECRADRGRRRGLAHTTLA